MIGQIRGILIHKQPPHLLVDVQGVAYEIEAPMTTFYKLPDTGVEVTLFTHLAIRDDAHLLFGFATHNERTMFRTLIKVNGVGAKMALTILSGMEADHFAQCIRDGDALSLVRLPGVGKKTAERLIIEMRDRLKDWELSSVASSSADNALGRASSQSDDAVSALIALGYKPQEASRLVFAVATDEMTSEEIIRGALKAFIKK
ncbi:MAG: Holliday junction branch migration protein RuvA [Proteobacteria bacterium]|nr:Holliday junction branch migration protein RuvA [Pseudomonadota bacterium]MCH8163478.1 Holliday junction branch migration protein RuvA [Pseudomonadota bacterium]MCH8976680.1 Holliday junction branch migration protein RuvA [Pseudomonadota bacterium]MCH9048096.1 Holliday junction branch migration protein RuvA [Pseudomonadota bacterium]